MATPEIRELRLKYKAAYTTYMTYVQAVSDASQNGSWPTAEVLKLEDEAFQDLSFLRQALLDALYAHAGKGSRPSTA